MKKKKSGPNGKRCTSKRRIEATERQAKALELRKEGRTIREIAKELGYSGPAGAFKAINAALKKTLQEPADELRQLICLRLDKWLEELWRKRDMIIKTDKHGCETRLHVKSVIDTALKIEKQRAELLGLNMKPGAPAEETPEDRAETPEPIDMEALRERARILTQGIKDAEEIKYRTGKVIKELEHGDEENQGSSEVTTQIPFDTNAYTS